MSEKVSDTILKTVISDFATANVKGEVLFDMLLTPLLKKGMTLNNGEEELRLSYLTKEFPMVNRDRESGKIQKYKDENKEYIYTCNADYLMKDEEKIYLIELKTTLGSIRISQDTNYQDVISRGGIQLESDFVHIINRYCKNSKSEKFGEIITFSKLDISEEVKKAKEEATDKLKEEEEIFNAYIVKNKKSSEKYLLQAYEVIKNNGLDSWEGKMLQMIYLVPNKEQIKKGKFPEKFKDCIVFDFYDLKKAIERVKITQEYKDMFNKIIDGILGIY